MYEGGSDVIFAMSSALKRFDFWPIDHGLKR